jgi:hypothetical protein
MIRILKRAGLARFLAVGILALVAVPAKAGGRSYGGNSGGYRSGYAGYRSGYSG